MILHHTKLPSDKSNGTSAMRLWVRKSSLRHTSLSYTPSPKRLEEYISILTTPSTSAKTYAFRTEVLALKTASEKLLKYVSKETLPPSCNTAVLPQTSALYSRPFSFPSPIIQRDNVVIVYLFCIFVLKIREQFQQT